MDEIDFGHKPQKKELDLLTEEVEGLLTQRRKRREKIDDLTRTFTDSLFQALQTAVYDLRKRGLTELGEPRLIDHPAGGGRRALQIPYRGLGHHFRAADRRRPAQYPR